MADLTQEQLGDGLGLTFQQVQKYEKGTNRLSLSRMPAVCKLLNCTVTDLLKGTDHEPSDVLRDPLIRLGQSTGGIELATAYNLIVTPSERAALVTLAKAMARATHRAEQPSAGT